MTGPTMNPPRAYHSIKALRSSTGEPLRADPLPPPTCADCGSPLASVFVGMAAAPVVICLTCWDADLAAAINDAFPAPQQRS